jgi:hypothetical protein
MTAHALKLSLGLLFGIRNILSLGWGNNRTHLLEKKMRKMLMTMNLHKKKEKIKRQKNGLIKKKYVSVKKHRQIVLLFYPSYLNHRRKDDNALMFSKNP